MTGRLKAGIAELDITGSAGIELAAEFTSRLAEGNRTPLMAKALVLSNDDRELAILTLDLYGLQPEAAKRLIKNIQERTGLPPEAVMVVCSHTRGAPYTTPVVGWPDVNTTYLEGLITKIPEVIACARQGQVNASLGVGHVQVPHLVYNHRLITRNMKTVTAWLSLPKDEVLEPEGPIDPEFCVIVIRDNRGFPICLLWNFAADNRFPTDDQISADLPFFVQQELDIRLGRHVPAFYLAGCGGNVSFNHGLEETADAVTSAVMAAQLETSCDPIIRLSCESEKMILPIRDTTRFWSKADIELKYPQALEAYAKEVEYMQQEGAHAVPAVVQAFRLGGFALVGLPGVPFVEFALEIKQQSPATKTLVAGNVGGHLGYLIPRKSFEHEGFEAWPARSAQVGSGGGEFVVEEALKLVNKLWMK